MYNCIWPLWIIPWSEESVTCFDCQDLIPSCFFLSCIARCLIRFTFKCFTWMMSKWSESSVQFIDLTWGLLSNWDGFLLETQMTNNNYLSCCKINSLGGGTDRWKVLGSEWEVLLCFHLRANIYIYMPRQTVVLSQLDASRSILTNKWFVFLYFSFCCLTLRFGRILTRLVKVVQFMQQQQRCSVFIFYLHTNSEVKTWQQILKKKSMSFLWYH